MATKLLPRDLLEVQLNQIDLLQAMYPDEILIDPGTKTSLDELRDWCHDEASEPTHAVPAVVFLTISILVEHSSDSAQTISLNVRVPLEADSTTDQPSGPPPLVIRVRQPAWLTKTQVVQLSQNMPPDDVPGAIEHIKEETSNIATSTIKASAETVQEKSQYIVRVWFYFPSISTREKRDDIVNYAPHYNLTGFLLAGKPGILCLEGESRRIDEYMKFIKTESWGDIPSQHKKVSERYRETGASLTRAFPDIQEITDLLDKRGERSNRNDMKALEAWLSDKQLAEAFSRVLL